MNTKEPRPKMVPQPRKRTVGVVMPKRENTIGVVYIKENKIYLAEGKSIVGEDGHLLKDLEDDSDDHLIESLNDIKKVFTKKELRNGSVA